MRNGLILNWNLETKCPNKEFFLARIQSKYGKLRTRNYFVFGHILHSGKRNIMKTRAIFVYQKFCLPTVLAEWKKYIVLIQLYLLKYASHRLFWLNNVIVLLCPFSNRIFRKFGKNKCLICLYIRNVPTFWEIFVFNI